MKHTDKFLQAYITAALWSSTDETTPQGGVSSLVQLRHEPIIQQLGGGKVVAGASVSLAFASWFFTRKNARTGSCFACHNESFCPILVELHQEVIMRNEYLPTKPGIELLDNTWDPVIEHGNRY